MFFAFLGSLDNPKSIGTNKLIKEFAKIATEPEDIIMNYKFLHKIEKEKLKKNFEPVDELNEISEEYRKIYKIITSNPIEINDIVKLSNMNIKEIMPKLTMLELEGKIKKVAGNRYIKCNM